MLQLLFYRPHSLAQFELLGRTRLAEGCLGEPLPEMVFDELNVFVSQGHDDCRVKCRY